MTSEETSKKAVGNSLESASGSATPALRLCVVGAGAIGGMLGVRLARAGVQLSAVARGATLEALRHNGWVLKADGEQHVAPVTATDDARTLGVQDVVLIAVKAHAMPSVLDSLAPLIGPDTLVVSALNGVPWWFTLGVEPGAAPEVWGHSLPELDPQGRLSAALPLGQLVGAVVYPACSSPQPGVAQHNSGKRIVLGAVASAGEVKPSAAARLAQLEALLNGAGLEAELTRDIRSEVWKKLLGNACFNPVSFVTGSATDLMIDDAHLYPLFVAMMGETLQVGKALGLDVDIEPVARIAVTRKLGNVKTSMLQDAEQHRAIELDAILGAVVALAHRLQLETPVNRAVYALARMRAQVAGLLSVQGGGHGH